jgi:hypothetical protein
LSNASHCLMSAGLASAGVSTARGELGLRHRVATETATHAGAPARTCGGVGFGLWTKEPVGEVDGVDVVEGVEPTGPTWPTGPQATNASRRHSPAAARTALMS